MILLQILDEGSVTDSQGRKVDFKVTQYFFYGYVKLLLIHDLSEYYHLSYEQPWQ